MNRDTTSSETMISTVAIDWRMLDGVRTRRVLAFLIDYCIVGILVVMAAIVVAVLGVATFGVGWLLYSILIPLVALSYIGWTMGGASQATIGMRVMSLHLQRYDGAPIDMVTAIVHAVLFWAGNAILTPFIVLVALFTRDKRMLHDIFLGTVVVRSDV